MSSNIRLAAAQLDFSVGNIEKNTTKIKEAILEAEKLQSDIIIFPELAVTGYPPEDLLLSEAFIDENLNAVNEIKNFTKDLNITVLLGFVAKINEMDNKGNLDSFVRPLANAVSVIYKGEQKGVVHKTLLPTYGVFDEARYFSRGYENETVFSIGDVTFGVPICEDLWTPGVSDKLTAKGANVLLVPNASPYSRGKQDKRKDIVTSAAVRNNVPVVYVANVGGQDELVFDGGTLIIDGLGNIITEGQSFKEEIIYSDVTVNSSKSSKSVIIKKELNVKTLTLPARNFEVFDTNEEIYLALTTGLKAYITKNGFKDVVLGLSGGIDSALVAILAADVFGGENVWGVGLPGPYSSGGSVSDARDLAENIKCKFDVLSIKELYEAEMRILKGSATEPGPFADTTFNFSEENLQARLRMTLLMAISNKHGNLLLTTGNKSETSVGYSTLYGDAAGGFAPIKDVYKTLVFDLCQWRNTLTQDDLNRLGLKSVVDPIPHETITKPPSAELAPGQRDDQSLPPYPVLDGILKRYVENLMSLDEILEDGFEKETVERVIKLVNINEYKRRQGAPGVKITERAFGRDRRNPITNGWRPTSRKELQENKFVTKASVEATLSSKMNAMSISSWWVTKNNALGNKTPNDVFLTEPEKVQVAAEAN